MSVKHLAFDGAQVWTAKPTLPLTYIRLFIGRVVAQLALVLLLIEAVFIAEKLNEIVLTVIDHRAPIIDIPLLVVLRMPVVFDLALPIATLVACFRVAFLARENREFLVFAGVGVSVQRLALIAWMIGAAAFLVSLLVSGIAAPAAHFAQRYLLFDARFAALDGDGPTGTFLGFDDYLVFAPSASERQPPPLYIHQRVAGTDDTSRIIIADGARLEGLHQNSQAFLYLKSPTILNFVSSKPAGSEPAGQPISCSDCTQLPRSGVSHILQAQNLMQSVDLGAMSKFPPRGISVREQSLFDLTGAAETSERSPVQAIEFGRRWGRALLCLLAPLLAGVALALTSRANQAVVVPVAVGLLFGLDVGLSTLAELAGAAGIGFVSLAVVIPVAMLAIAATALASQAHNLLITPAMARV
jgi:lipopolysaccharide export LptBFGC system permease protein LptF